MARHGGGRHDDPRVTAQGRRQVGPSKHTRTFLHRMDDRKILVYQNCKLQELMCIHVIVCMVEHFRSAHNRNGWKTLIDILTTQE